MKTKRERGITLVALIITIIVLVILAAVSIAAVYNSRIVNYAINGTQDYAKQGIKENEVLEGTEKLIESAVKELEKIRGGEEPNPKPETPTGLTKEELSQNIMIGKYVDYKPQGTDYTVDGAYSGAGKNQTFAKNDDMKWRIWGVEGDKLLLISETLAGNITLKGANGYNNAVKILNDACSTAFGNSKYSENEIKVRSINQDDIDKVTNMTTDKQRTVAYSNYGTTEKQSYENWPNIYAQEPGKTGGGSLDRSSQSSWYTGTTNSSFTGTYTYYKYNITNYAKQTMYDALLTNMTASSTSGTDSHPTYWVASRCVDFGSSYAYFSVFFVCKGSVGDDWLYYSGDNTYLPTLAVRPFIEVNLGSVAVGVIGDGTADLPYSMATK